MRTFDHWRNFNIRLCAGLNAVRNTLQWVSRSILNIYLVWSMRYTEEIVRTEYPGSRFCCREVEPWPYNPAASFPTDCTWEQLKMGYCSYCKRYAHLLRKISFGLCTFISDLDWTENNLFGSSFAECKKSHRRGAEGNRDRWGWHQLQRRGRGVDMTGYSVLDLQIICSIYFT